MSRFEGQVPGGVLKTIVEEHQVMDELVQLLKRRVDLDEKYNQDLAALYGNFNPKWKNSAIYSLFSPVLAFFEKDVTIRRETCESIKDILDDIPVTNSPDILEEGGSMFDEYQKLIEVNERLKENHEAARSRDSVAKLQEWLSIVAPKSKYGEQGLFTTIQVFNSVQMAGFRLPEADRKYRQSVYLQQQIAWKVSKWHSNVLPNILETHQDRSDRIKAMLQKVGNCYSDQSNWMVEELSMVKDRLNAFSSVDYITSKHEAQSAEAGHEFIQPARYVNSVTRRSSSVVMYGLELEQVKFLGAFRKNIETLSEVRWPCPRDGATSDMTVTTGGGYSLKYVNS
ncbi:hypothetical protein CPB86DRAFT_873881 [Serendipita vermifera]|nr:hypothetical protein CPB86DRAFT_873881 [Serendipita vermifera]